MNKGVLGIGYSVSNGDDYALAKLGPLLDEAASLNVDFIELPLYALDVIGGGRVLPERLRRVKALTSGRPFRYTAHGPLGLNFLDEEELLPMSKEVFKACLEVTAELGGVHFVMHTGIYDKARESDAEVLYARQRDILADFAGLAEAHGLVVAVENVFGSGPSRRTALPSRLAKEIAAIGHPAIRACLDVSHGFLTSNRARVSPLEEAAALAPYAKHLHIHDSFGRLTYRHTTHRAERVAFGDGDLHMPLGMGAIPWDELIGQLAFPDGVIFMLELAPPYWTELAASIEKVRVLAARALTGALPGMVPLSHG